MSNDLAITTRALRAADARIAADLASAADVHGVYVRNALEHATDGDRSLGFFRGDRLVALAFFGHRGNLVVVEAEPVDPTRSAAAIESTCWAWRIALGSDRLVRALADREPLTPLVDRTQVYYGVRPGEPLLDGADLAVRNASRGDVPALVQAALDLNESDLSVPPWRVNRRWLRDSVKRRIREGRTFVAGPEGSPWCKVDIGSRGPAGVVLEGVFTIPERRGRGLARRVVAAVSRELLESTPLVCLHVAADNEPARRAYERVGMRELDRCHLLLRG